MQTGDPKKYHPGALRRYAGVISERKEIDQPSSHYRE
nr:MAG TPA: hypothetical protein [Herelleviridae sp.]